MSKIHDDLRRAEEFRHGSRVVSGLRIKGEIIGNEDLTVDGVVEGPIELSEGKLTVGNDGKVSGNVTASEVDIHGSVTGNLCAKRLEIRNSGSMVGDVATGRIVIDDGAFYKGSIEIGTKESPATKAKAATASTPAKP